MKKTKLEGKRVVITNRDSIYYGEWGIVRGFDGDVYYVAIANDENAMPVFNRDEFKVRRTTA